MTEADQTISRLDCETAIFPMGTCMLLGLGREGDPAPRVNFVRQRPGRNNTTQALPFTLALPDASFL